MKRRAQTTEKSKYRKIQAPDFEKTISREHLDRIQGDKKTVIPFTIPKHEGTWASKFNI